MGKTRDVFKKITDSKGTFQIKMGTIKHRTCMALTEAEEVARIHKLCEKGLNDPDNHNGVITHLEPDILGIWGLVGIRKHHYKACGGDGIPAELFQILKDDAVKVLHSICQQIWKTQQWPQDWKNVSFHSNPKEGQCQRMFKVPHNCTHFTC